MSKVKTIRKITFVLVVLLLVGMMAAPLIKQTEEAPSKSKRKVAVNKAVPEQVIIPECSSELEFCDWLTYYSPGPLEDNCFWTFIVAVALLGMIFGGGSSD